MQMDQYFQANAVNINSNKIEYMVLCPKGKDATIFEPLFYRDSALREVGFVKFLEVL